MITSPIEKAVILAAGMGTRMRSGKTSAAISDQQQAAADTGVKAMIPFGDPGSGSAPGPRRPFLDYTLGRLAQAGFRSICLVIGPRHRALREYYEQLRCDRLSIQYAIQQQPLGTADAVAAAEAFAGQGQFLVINSDNLYPADVLGRLRLAGGPATAGFDPRTVLDPAQHSVERLAAMAVMQPDENGYLKQIVEKPDATSTEADGPSYISMNCWRLGPAIFEACERTRPSLRGEKELPSAIQLSIDHLAQKYRILPSRERVLDLSHRDDIARVARVLSAEELRL